MKRIEERDGEVKIVGNNAKTRLGQLLEIDVL